MQSRREQKEAGRNDVLIIQGEDLTETEMPYLLAPVAL